MTRPSRRQWAVLWVGVIAVLLTLAVADEYVVRGVFASLLVTGLLFWQLGPKVRQPHRDPGPPPPVQVIEGAANDGDTPEAAPSTPTGVRGWLALLVFGLGIVVPLSPLPEIVKIAESARNAWEFGGGLAAMIIVAAVSLYVSIALWRRWPGAAKMALRFIVAVAVLGIVELALTVASEVRSPDLVAQRVSVLVWAALWGAYLLKSRRVRNTYAVPAEGVRVSRWKARAGVSVFTALILWFGTAAYRQAEVKIEKQYAVITPDQWVRAARQLDPAFSEDFGNGVLERLRAGIPNSTLMLAGPVEFEELGAALRATVRYTAEIGADSANSTLMEGQVISYFHSAGVASIESGCIPELLQCSGMTDMLATAEAALLPRLNGSRLSGILPPGKCSTEGATVPATVLADDRSMMVVSCTYTDSEAASLSLARLSATEARSAFEAAIELTPQFKRTMVRQVRAGT